MWCQIVLCALFPAVALGEVLVFGRNDQGQLGVTKDIVRSPENLKTFDGLCVKHSDVTKKNSIFVTCDGQVYVGGANVAANGAYSMDAANIAKQPVLVEELSGHKVVMSAIGDGHFVVLTQEGKVLTWGYNQEGQLGYGTDVPFSAQPLEVVTLDQKNIRMIAAGGNRSAAISDEGKLYIWGSGHNGEMGDGTTRSHRKPTLVESFVETRERVCHVAIGDGHVVAVTNAGDMYTWGDGAAGQLGLGDFGMQKKKPMPVSRLRRNVCYATAGEDFTAAITQDERVFLWGSNGYPNPFEKTFFQGKHARQIGSGSSHMIVILDDGSVATWGSKRYGQAGRDFGGEFTLDPALIPGLNARQVAVGASQTIVLTNPDFPAVSLCPCLKSWFSHWRKTEKYVATCTDEQSTCEDGSCCSGDETCCRVDDRELVPVKSYHAIDDKPDPMSSAAFRCLPTKNAVCCAPQSEMGCNHDFKCVLDASPARCEPSWAHEGMSEEDRAGNSEQPLRSKVLSSVPGFQPGAGFCGPRKETCPDETCCGSGQTCCPLPDGSFGCCAHDRATCCGNGCCREGYECDNDRFSCVKKTGTEIEKIKQDDVEGHCGANKRQCPDRSCCPAGGECCVLNDGFFGCCPFTNGVCCTDGAGCCPNGHSCDVPNGECVRKDDDGESRVQMKTTPRNTPQRSGVGEVTCPNSMSCQYPGTCCPSGDNFMCCDFVNATCCGGLGCCPSDFECDATTSTCKPHNPKGKDVPMKFTRDAKPKQHVDESFDGCAGKTKCSDNKCCPLGATCCTGPLGESTCCDYMEAICCSDGGCCASDHVCDVDSKVCRDRSGKESYSYLPSQKSSAPAQSKDAEVSSPGKCYPDEIKCNNDMCCPNGATCCDKGFGQTGCCPHTHGVCCDGGGCCPTSSVCNTELKTCVYPNDADKQPAPMLSDDVPHPPEAIWDKEECWDDEQTCSGDGGCCLKTETCCLVHGEDGSSMSACCPFQNGVCCGNGGCCPFETQCDETNGVCVDYTGKPVNDLAVAKGSALHPLAGLAEIDCPDGSVCGAFDTCCSLGVDEEWGGEVFGCCPFENAVCCKEFEGCCPGGFECEAETKSCVTEGREMPGSSNSQSDPPPTYVCKWPLTQCPNGQCCEEGDQCVEAGGNYRCLPRGYASCNNGTHACPQSLFCELRNSEVVCSEVQDNDPKIKEDLLHKYWGDDVSATCAALMSANARAHAHAANAHALLQAKAESKFFSPNPPPPPVEQNVDAFSPPPPSVPHPPATFWYSKRLVLRSKAAKTTPTSLPTVLAAKICQHIPIRNSTAATEFCFLSNANGHFLMKERDRVKTLVDEYTRRLCFDQNCMAPVGRVYEFVPEEIDPCPCREKPEPKFEWPDWSFNWDTVAGSNDAVQQEVMQEVQQAEQQASKPSNHSLHEKPQFILPVTEIADEKPASALGMGTTSSGTVPVAAETPAEDMSHVKYTLVLPNRDDMQLTQQLEAPNVIGPGDQEMKSSHRPETFMGKEACNDNKEDEAEVAVDLDGDEALQLDAQSDSQVHDITLAQMDAPVLSGSSTVMPEQA